MAILDNRKIETSKIKRKDRKCSECGNVETYIDNAGREYWFADIYRNKNWDKESYLCLSCYNKRQTLYRTVGVDRDSNDGKAAIDQAVVVKVLDIEDLNIRMDNFRWHIDAEDKKNGKIDIKGECLSSRGVWNFSTRNKIDCDTYICLGYDRNRKKIEAVFVVPNEDWVINLTKLNITKNSCRTTKYNYDRYKVDSTVYDDTYQDLMLYLGNKRFFNIEDIKRWLKRK